jgi:CCR4-NOT transcription complex subunit 3
MHRINGADIKDKTPLFDARKAIEREMERFKACEKEAKMKQFSKAALGLADKLDPREQAKVESRSWINEVVEQLNVQVRA